MSAPNAVKHYGQRATDALADQRKPTLKHHLATAAVSALLRPGQKRGNPVVPEVRNLGRNDPGLLNPVDHVHVLAQCDRIIWVHLA